MAVSYNVDDILQVKKNCMSSCKKLVVYADTSLCFPCYVKQLPNWYNLINSVKRDCGESVEFCFIINVQKQKLNEKKKQKFEEMKKRELEKQKEESLKKQEEIKLESDTK